MTPNMPSSPALADAAVPTWRQWLRRLYLLAAGVFTMSVVTQVFLAGAAVLVAPAYWGAHRIFGNTLELQALALLLIGLATRLPWRLQALGAALYALTFMQYVFLYLMPQIGAPLLRALHAVNALALFGVAVALVGRVWVHVRR